MRRSLTIFRYTRPPDQPTDGRSRSSRAFRSIILVLQSLTYLPDESNERRRTLSDQAASQYIRAHSYVRIWYRSIVATLLVQPTYLLLCKRTHIIMIGRQREFKRQATIFNRLLRKCQYTCNRGRRWRAASPPTMHYIQILLWGCQSQPRQIMPTARPGFTGRFVSRTLHELLMGLAGWLDGPVKASEEQSAAAATVAERTRSLYRKGWNYHSRRNEMKWLCRVVDTICMYNGGKLRDWWLVQQQPGGGKNGNKSCSFAETSRRAAVLVDFIGVRIVCPTLCEHHGSC